MSDAATRLEIVRQVCPAPLDGAVLVESWSNDAWLTRDSVLRVCWQGDRERLLRECQLLECLPESVPHASVVASGRVSDLTWTVMRRSEGERLDLLWPQLSDEEERTAVIRLGTVLRALHEWQPPLAVRQLLGPSLTTSARTRAEVVGEAVVPLSDEGRHILLDWIDELPGVSAALARGARRRVDELSPLVAADELVDGVVVHGDAHFANVLWHQGHLVALLDFEWARTGPPDLELEAACREDPLIEAATGTGPLRMSEVPMLEWLRVGYPGLFEQELLTERLWLYDLGHQLRRLSAAGTTEIDPQQENRLRSLVNGPRVAFS